MHALGFFMRISGKIFQSRFAQKLSIKFCLKIFNQGSIDPDQFFNRGPARKDEDPTTYVRKRIRRSYPLPVIG